MKWLYLITVILAIIATIIFSIWLIVNGLNGNYNLLG